MKKNKINTILGIVIVILIIIISLTSYAIWQTTKKQTHHNAVGSACLNITLQNESNDIYLPTSVPISDTEGEETTPYEFTIKNECDTPVNYTVALESIKDDEHPNDSDYLNPDYVKVMLNYTSPISFSDLVTLTDDTDVEYDIISTKKILNRQLGANESKSFKLRLWIDENTPAEEADGTSNASKIFYSKIKVIAGTGIQDECYAITSSGVLIDYNPECGQSVTIPAEVNGIQVTSVAKYAFYSDDVLPFTYFMDSSVTMDDVDFSILFTKNLVYKMYEGTPGIPELSQAEIDNLSINDVVFVNRRANADTEINNAICNLEDNDPDGAYPMAVQLVESFTDENDDPYTIDSIMPYCNSQSIGRDPLNINSDTIPPMGMVAHYTITEDSNNPGTYIPTFVGVTYDGTIFNVMSGSEASVSLIINNVDFSDSDNLTNIDKYAFKDYAGAIELPDSLRTIGEGAFQNYTGNSITFNNGLTSIGSYAFEKYNGDELNLPSTVVSIGEGAFNRFEGHNYELILPSSLTTIGEEAFEKYYGEGTTLTIPNSVTVIEWDAFYNFVGDALNLPNNLKVVGSFAFSHYAGSELNLPNTLTTIGYGAFSGYNGNEITLPSSLETIWSEAFASYQGLGTDLVIPSGVTLIDSKAFSQFNGNSLTLNEGLLYIGDAKYPLSWNAGETFRNYVGYDSSTGVRQELVIPSTVKSIAAESFWSFNGTLILNDGIEIIGPQAFNDYNGDDVDIPASVTIMGSHVFNSMGGNITVHSEELYNTRSSWAPYATVILDV